MYMFIDIKHPLKATYLGIKKDKLPEDGGVIYWSTSQNEEFLKLVQGNEPRFILEIIDFRKRIDYNYLQLKEYNMLQKYPNIQTNPASYNLSYGIPPLSKDNLPTKEFFDWFKETRASGIWDSTERVDVLLNIGALQIREEDDPSHVKDIVAELKPLGGNSKNMKSVLVFEGVGGKFGFKEDSDVVGGTTHGLTAAKKSNVIEMQVTRVPNDVLKNKSSYFIRALAGNDNYVVDPLVYKPTYQDGAKLLVTLYNDEKISPKSEIAKDQLIIIYNLKTRAIDAAVKKALTDIEMNKKGNTKWKVWSSTELDSKVIKTTNDETLSMYMSSGMYDYRKIFKKIYEDVEKRTKMIIYIHHPNVEAHDTWGLENSEYNKFLKTVVSQWKITFKELESEVVDTTNPLQKP